MIEHPMSPCQPHAIIAHLAYDRQHVATNYQFWKMKDLHITGYRKYSVMENKTQQTLC
jgi:hypothetical protein